MSIAIVAPPEDKHAERWRQWQLSNAKSSHRADIQARAVFAIVLTASALWLCLQLLAAH